MTPEERLTALENSLLKMNSPQMASADSLKFYKYQVHVPHTVNIGEAMNILLYFITVSEDAPLVMLHRNPNAWGGVSYMIHPSSGSTKNTKKYYVQQNETTTYILLSTQPGSFYRA